MNGLTLRPAEDRDALDVLAWRNDPITRAMSRHVEAVAEPAHLQWFSRALANPTCALWIAEVAGEKVGLVRCDHGIETEISININPACRGRGLGEAALRATLATVDTTVIAYVKDENLTSRRLFERCGFKLERVDGGLCRYVKSAAA